MSLDSIPGTTLAGRYAVERELGHGGMALVFLAQDLKYHRPVAIKVLRPEIAAAIGSERFLREIDIVARLNHPHILSLLDSGETGGLLYYVMPVVEGGSLRERLIRERQLPVEEALEIARQVASALAYADSCGVVHRDIKPENILVAGNEIVVTDFGIAKAVSAVGAELLTTTGISVGTPAYMSPEQAAAEPVDGRSDVFSLGCVLYEMLAGRPPFDGPTAQAIQARRMMDPVPPLRTVRGTVPANVEQAIEKALAKSPADRFRTAAEFAEALVRPLAGSPSPDRERGPGGEVPWRRFAWTVAVTAGLALFVWLARHQWGKPAVVLDPNLVAVLPFRVTGADSTLGEGMVELLAAKLTGEGGPRAASPQSVISAWRRVVFSEGKQPSQESLLRLASRLAAGKLLLGSLVRTPGQLIISASLLGVPNGREQVRGEVVGPPDSLLSLVDQLTSRLLIANAGQTPSLASLTSVSLPALQAYLEGRAAYRRGRFEDAVHDFHQAVQLDSTFALAALALAEASEWFDAADVSRGIRLAWSSRERLSARDRLMLAAQAGPRYPALSSQAEVLAARESLVKVEPDHPEAWYLLGDQLFHWGTFLGLEEAWPRASAAFRHALEVDSTVYIEPLVHLVHINAVDGDTAAVRRYAALVLASDSLSEEAKYERWLVALELEDSSTQAARLLKVDSMSSNSLFLVIHWQLLEGNAYQDAQRTLNVFRSRASTAEDRDALVHVRTWIALNAGHPPTAVADLPSEEAVLNGLYWDGDSVAAAAAARALERHAEGLLAHTSPERAIQYQDICALEQWRLLQGQVAGATRAIRLLQQTQPGDEPETVAVSEECAALLDAMLAVAERRHDAPRIVDRIDSLMKTGPSIMGTDPSLWVVMQSANLVVARLREAEGNFPAALAAVRRREAYYIGPPLYRTTYLREEGRLAALTGDTAGAIRAYSKYLQFRSDPAPALKPQVNRVREELARLVGEKH